MESIFNFELSPEEEADILADEYISGYEAAFADMNVANKSYFLVKLAELYTRKASLLSEFYRNRITEIFETVAGITLGIN